MKLLLTCDQVFDRLTRGPFSGRDVGDDVLEDHLAACHECRSLAEALRPAVALFGDGQATPPTTDRDLPVYRGRLPEAAEPCSSSSDRGGSKFQRAAWQLVAAALVGVLVGSALTHVKSGQRGPAGVRNWLGLSNAAQADSADPWTFASLRLSQACRAPASRDAAALSPAREQVACCTRCHFAHSVHTPPVEMSRLLVACLACHGG